MAVLHNIPNAADGRLLPLVEDFYTIQGEGFHAGRAAYFIRLGGCDVGCSWCDAKYTWNRDAHPRVGVSEIVDRVVAAGACTAVITGGEPLLWPLELLTEALHACHIAVFLETSGVHPFSGDFDWVCLSPKHRRPPLAEAFERADELKVVVSGEMDLEWAEEQAAKVTPTCRLYLQPEWSVAEQVIPRMVEYVKTHPRWCISIQTHKYMQIP